MAEDRKGGTAVLERPPQLERPATRGPDEVFAEHLRRRGAGELEDDLRDNFAADVTVLTASGIHRGHDGVRFLAQLLRQDLPDATFHWRNALVDRDVAWLEWSATTPGGTEDEGVDTFVIRDGRIVAWTMHVASWR